MLPMTIVHGVYIPLGGHIVSDVKTMPSLRRYWKSVLSKLGCMDLGLRENIILSRCFSVAVLGSFSGHLTRCLFAVPGDFENWGTPRSNDLHGNDGDRMA